MHPLRLLWISDSPLIDTAFSRITRKVLARLTPFYDVHQIGFGYEPTPATSVGWPVYRCTPDKSAHAVISETIQKIRPSVIVSLANPGNIPFMGELRPDYARWICLAAIDDERFLRRETKVFLSQANKLLTFGWGPEQIFPGLDDIQPHPNRMDMREGVAALADRFVVGFLGRNQPRKNLGTLLQAVAHIVHKTKAIPNLALLLRTNAEDPFGHDLLELRDQLDLRDVVFFIDDPLPDNELGKFYAGLDLFAYLSHAEAIGIPVFEALHCQCPAVVSDLAVFNAAPLRGTTPWAKDSPLKIVPCHDYINSDHQVWRICDHIAAAKAIIEAPHAPIEPQAWLLPYTWQTCANKIKAAIEEQRQAPVQPARRQVTEKPVAMIVSEQRQCGITEHACYVRDSGLADLVQVYSLQEFLQLNASAKVIHVQYEPGATQPERIPGLYGRCDALIATLHNRWAVDGIAGLFKGIICHSLEDFNHLFQLDLPTVRLVHFPIPVWPFPLREKFPHSRQLHKKGEFTIGCVGFANPNKNYDKVAVAAARIKSMVKPIIELRMMLSEHSGTPATSAQYAKKCFDLARNSGFDDSNSYLRYGYFSLDDIAAFLEGVDLVVFPYEPSRYTGQSAATKLALASGAMSLATPAGIFLTDIIEHGIASPATHFYNDKPQRLDLDLAELIEDTAEQERLRGAAARYEAKYTWDKCAEAHKRLYAELGVK